MLKRIWNAIKNYFNLLFDYIDPDMVELEELRRRRNYLFTNYMDLDKRTSAARCIKEDLEKIELRIAELEAEIYEN
jgi:uncharacterized protein YutE (UPF0331/DUF86 family)